MSNHGIGGGISWVLDPKFCEQLLPRFPEESVAGGLNIIQFVTCTDIEDAFSRGFATFKPGKLRLH